MGTKAGRAKKNEHKNPIEGRLARIEVAVAGIQDLILSMKTTLEAVVQSRSEADTCARVVSTASSNLSTFLNERDDSCRLADWCTKVIQRAATKVIHVYMEKGSPPALKLIDYYLDVSLKEFDAAQCPDGECYKNGVNVFKALRDLIEGSWAAGSRLSKSLYSPELWQGTRRMSEQDICDRITPLANVLRLQLLKTLGKGGAAFSELERETGAKGGHLRFHLAKLVRAGYVVQERPMGRYLITPNGLKALQVTHELGTILF